MVELDIRKAVDRHGIAQVAAWLLVDVAALNWGLVELFDVNLVADTLPADATGIVYLVVAAAGLVGLLENLTDVEVLG